MCDKNNINIEISTSNKKFSYYWIKLFTAKHISNHIIKNCHYLRFFLTLYSSTFLYASSISLEHSVKALKCFKLVLLCLLIKNWYVVSYGSLVHKSILSVTSWWLNKFNKEFDPDSEPPTIYFLLSLKLIIWIIFFFFFFFLTLSNSLTLIRLGFLKLVFPGEGQFDPPFIFQEELI